MQLVTANYLPMKKLITLAFIAGFVFTSQSVFSQNIVLINGTPTEVTLEGEQITKLEAKDVSSHMTGYEKEIQDIFSNAILRMTKANKELSTRSNVLSFKNSPVKSEEKDQNEQVLIADSKLEE